MKDFSRLLKSAQALFFLNAVIWLAFGFYTFVGMANRYPGHTSVVVIGIMMMGNAGAMMLSGFFIGKRIKWFYYFAVLLLIINIVLTVTDQFGFFDFATMVIDVVLLGILLFARKRLLSDL